MEARIIKYFKIISTIAVNSVLIGLLFNLPPIYLGLSTGLFVTMINNLLLYRSVVKIAYEYKGIGYFISNLLLRFAIYIASLIFIVYISKRYNLPQVKLSVVLACVGFMSIKILLYFDKYIVRKE